MSNIIDIQYIDDISDIFNPDCYDLYSSVGDSNGKSYLITMVINILQNWSHRYFSHYSVIKICMIYVD